MVLTNKKNGGVTIIHKNVIFVCVIVIPLCVCVCVICGEEKPHSAGPMVEHKRSESSSTESRKIIDLLSYSVQPKTEIQPIPKCHVFDNSKVTVLNRVSYKHQNALNFHFYCQLRHNL